MSALRPRKRRRSQAFPDEDDDNDVVVATGENGNDSFGPGESDGKLNNDQLEKEREVWDAFREEHFEAVEQMPLTLHRQFTLMRELDQQTHGYTADLLPTLHKYISQRRAMAPSPPPLSQPKPTDEPLEGANNPTGSRPQDEDPHPKEEYPSTPPTGFLSRLPNGTPPSQLRLEAASPTKAGPSTPLRKLQAESLSTPRTPTPMGIPPERVKVPQTTREMLSHIAWLSEELLRASEEKVNLAQAAYDSVNRHIRLLEQAIREQEVSISLGIRPGTHPAPILLPDLVVPRWGRPSRTTLSPIPNLSGDGEGERSNDVNVGGGDKESESGPVLGLVPRRGPGRPRIHPLRRKGIKGPGSRKGGNPAEQEDSEEIPDRVGPPSRVRSSNLKITLPPLPPAVVPPPDMVIDPTERRYCYCNQVSFGEMIACDNGNCKHEWFHLGCAGLTEPPKPSKKWYCRECTAARNRKRK